ncbi:MAG: DUF86 domain-containing protein [Firmicutes bacterium]|nr:DUF86 domain-containing protein [Bacillota bacterium]
MQHKDLNLDRIGRKVADVTENLNVLWAYAAREEQDFLGNPEAVRSAKYAFIVLIEACLAIANHFCARLLAKAPGSYAEAYLCLGEGGIIEIELAQRLAQMARFRNLIVHGYDRVDDKLMFYIMKNNLSDVELFLDAVELLVK